MKGIVFDLDGTLVDSIPDVTSALNRAFAEVGIPPVVTADVEPAMGHGAEELVAAVARTAAPGRAFSEDSLVQLCTRYQQAYADEPAVRTTTFADASEALEALHRSGVRVGICTNKTTDLAHEVLRAVGLDRYITSVIGRDTAAHPKPDPRHLLEVVAALGLAPTDVVYVGDNPIDLAVASGAEVDYRHVGWGVPVDGVETISRFSELVIHEPHPASRTT